MLIMTKTSDDNVETVRKPELTRPQWWSTGIDRSEKTAFGPRLVG
jgi:hypothetical protein